MCQIWKKVWGSEASRVVCVLASAAATPPGDAPGSGCGDFGCYNLNCDDCIIYGQLTQRPYTYADAIAIAPYIGTYRFPAAWGGDSDGGLNKFFQQVNSGGLIPTAASATISGGTSSAYSMKSGLRLSGMPTNATVVAIKLHTKPTTGATIAVDFVGPLQLQFADGTPVNDLLQGDTFSLVYISRTSAGTTTPGWRLSDIASTTQGPLNEAEQWTWRWSRALAKYYSKPLISYEGGRAVLYLARRH